MDAGILHRSLFLILLLLGMGPVLAVAQQDVEWGLSAGAGWNTYVGDLNPDADGRQYNMTLSGFRYVEERTFARFSIHSGRISGETRPGITIDPESRAEANRYFEADIRSVDLSFNRVLYDGGWIAFYTGIGFGLLDFYIEDREGRNLRNRPQSRLEGEEYDNLVPHVPINAGVQLFASGSAQLTYERSWNYTNSDYLDNLGLLGESGSDWVLRRSIALRYRW